MEYEVDKWSEGVEEVLQDQQNKCAAYKWMHENQCRTLNRRYKMFNIINIFIVSFTATFTTVKDNVNTDSPIHSVEFITPGLLYFSAVITSLQQFLNFQKEAEKNRNSAIKYTELYYNIKRTLALERNQRQQIKSYYNWVNKEYDNIFSSAPDVEQYSVKDFEKKFNIGFNIINNKNSDEEEPVICVRQSHSQSDSGKIKYELDRFISHSYE